MPVHLDPAHPMLTAEISGRLFPVPASQVGLESVMWAGAGAYGKDWEAAGPGGGTN